MQLNAQFQNGAIYSMGCLVALTLFLAVFYIVMGVVDAVSPTKDLPTLKKIGRNTVFSLLVMSSVLLYLGNAFA